MCLLCLLSPTTPSRICNSNNLYAAQQLKGGWIHAAPWSLDSAHVYHVKSNLYEFIWIYGYLWIVWIVYAIQFASSRKKRLWFLQIRSNQYLYRDWCSIQGHGPRILSFNPIICRKVKKLRILSSRTQIHSKTYYTYYFDLFCLSGYHIAVGGRAAQTSTLSSADLHTRLQPKCWGLFGPQSQRHTGVRHSYCGKPNFTQVQNLGFLLALSGSICKICKLDFGASRPYLGSHKHIGSPSRQFERLLERLLERVAAQPLPLQLNQSHRHLPFRVSLEISQGNREKM